MRSEERHIRWTTWDGETADDLNVGYENGGWTAQGTVSSANVSYVMRFNQQWELRQFLLFRDLDEPDLWLATDGNGRWGETNGVAREDLEGCSAVAMACTPFSHSLAVKRLDAASLAEHTFMVAMLDVDTLGLVVHEHTVRHLGDDWWTQKSSTTGSEVTFRVDPFGLIVDEPERFRRI